jgi:amylosucrase
VPYLGRGEAANKECELAYHNVFMVMLWSALAERKVALLTHALQNMPGIPSSTSWCTYVRCHDDIGWAVTEEDAAGVGLNGHAHRAFLSDFYTGRFPTSFARGTTFQFNPKTNDRRVNGALASLAGLEIALEKGDEREIDLAVRRILLLHNLILAFGGIPLLYMGDELGLLNDTSYEEDEMLAADGRWLHRPRMDWQVVEKRGDAGEVNGRIYQSLRQLIEARQRTDMLHAQAARIPVWTHNDHVFGLVRESARGRLLVLANFTEAAQGVTYDRLAQLGFSGQLINHLKETFEAWQQVWLRPYQAVWLESVS